MKTNIIIKQQQEITKIPLKITKWNNLPWDEINNKIWILQDEIVKATLMNDMKRVYKLQRKLVCSFEGRALAIRKVTTNSGSKTPGVDSIIWDNSHKKFEAIQTLNMIIQKPNDYKAQPLKRIMIPKPGKTEERPLGIPTMIDRAVQAVYHLAIDPVIETNSDKYSFGFRKGRSAGDAITYLRTFLDKKGSAKFVLEADIKKCFDKISHEYLIKYTPICDKNVLKQWLESGYIYKGKYYPTTEGTPQGGIISPLLCNTALNGLEAKLAEKYPKNVYKTGQVNIIRYADDFVVTGKTKEILEEVQAIVTEFLKERGLELNLGKTRITEICAKQGIDFLGFNISRKPFNPKLNQESKQETVLIIKPSKGAITKFSKEIKSLTMKNFKLETLITRINPVIRGWANYFKISYHSQETFITLEHRIWMAMMSWVKRNNPKGSLKRNVNKYLVTNTNSTHKWTWGIHKPNNEKRKIETFVMLHISEFTPVKISFLNANLNPYASENKEYFMKRSITRTESDIRNKVYKQYNYTCPQCGDTLFNGEQIDLDHIIPMAKGGTYKIKNLRPLHQTCHENLHGNNQIVGNNDEQQQG
jgi:RNA-directed DNA polymerase